MAVALKVLFPSSGQTKAMRFSLDVPIQQVIAEIKEKITFDGQDHGLFQNELVGKNKARWLKENHTLKFYNLGQDMEVVFKKKTRPLKVRLVDNTVKTILIDDTAKVSVIRDTVGKRLGIKSSEEYGLKCGDKWLQLAAGLYEQDVKEEDTLVFDKNYFFFDDAIDKSDPIQLHLIFTKAVQSVIEGTYPVSVDEAVALAGVQAQVQLGNWDAEKHPLDKYAAATFLPASAAKDKKHTPKKLQELMQAEHKKLVNTSEENAKYKYVQMVRALPTYGITFYTVQVPHDDKKKAKAGKTQDLLLGITREKIMHLDAATKQPIREYPLVHLKRWAAVRGKFTFDFGDHEDAYWTVFTDQGDQISALIAGYIDIIIAARKQGVKQIEVDQRTGLAAEEDIAVMGVAQSAFYASNSGRGAQQQPGQAPGEGALTMQVVDLGSAMRMAELLREELGQPLSVADRRATRRMSVSGEAQWLEQLLGVERGMDEDLAKLVDGALNFATKEDLNALASAMGSKLRVFGPLAQHVAAASPDTETIQGASQLVLDSIKEVLRGTQNAASNPHDGQARQLLGAAKQKYDAAMLLMRSAQSGQLSDAGTKELVESLMRAVTLAVQGLRTDASELEHILEGQHKTLVHNFGAQLEPARGALEQAATTLSGALLNPNARKHVVDAGQFLASLANQLDSAARRGGATPEWLDRIGRSAGGVTDALKLLLQALETAEDRGAVAEVDEALRRAHHAAQSLRESGGNQKAMLQNIKELGSAANDVIKQALALAKTATPEVRAQLEQGAATLKEALATLTEAGKEAIKLPNDLALRDALFAAARAVEDGVATLAADVKSAAAAANLRAAAKAALGQALALSQGVQLGLFLQEPNLAKANVGTQQLEARVALKLEAASMGDALKGLLGALQQASAQPHANKAQEGLLNATKQLGPQMAKLVASAKRGEGQYAPAVSISVVQDANATQEKVSKLLSAVQGAQKADVSGADIGPALKTMDANKAQIESTVFAATAGALVASADSREGAVEVLQQCSERVQGSLDSLGKSAQGQGQLNVAANEVASALGDLITASEGVAASMHSTEQQQKLLSLLSTLANDAEHFLKTAKALRADRSNANANAANDAARSAVQRSLGGVMSVALGHDSGEVEAAVKAVRAEATALRAVKQDGVEFAAAAKQLAARNKAIAAAAQHLATTAKSNPRRVGATAKLLPATVKQLVLAASNAAGAAADEGTRTIVLSTSKRVVEEAALVMERANEAALTGHHDGLDAALQQLGASVAALDASVSASAFPVVDQAVERVKSAAIRLEMPTDAVLKQGQLQGRPRKEILRELDASCLQLGGSMAGLLSAARMGTEKVGIYAAETGESVTRIVDAAVAATLPVAAQKSVTLDVHVQEYLDKCDEIIANPANTAAVGPATVAIGNLTKTIGASARDVAGALQGEQQRQYVAAAKAMAAGVPKLVAAVKGGKPALVSKCAEFLKNTAQKLEAARLGVDLDDLAGGADAAVPVPVQKELSASAKAVSVHAAQFLQASAQLASDPRNALLGHALGSASDALTEAVAAVASLARSLDPVKHTCQETAEALQQALAELDVALVNAGMGLLERDKSKAPQRVKQELAELVQSFAPDITALHEKLGVSARDVQQAAERIMLKSPQLVAAATQVAAADGNPASAKKVVALTKEFAQSMLELVNEVEVGGDALGDKAKGAAEKLGDVLGQVKQADEMLTELGDVVKKLREMASQGAQAHTAAASANPKPYAELKEALVSAARAVTSAATALQTCDLGNVGTVALQGKSLARTVPPLLALVKDAAPLLADPAARAKLAETAGELFEGVADLIGAAAAVAKEDDLTNRAALKAAWDGFMDAMPAFLGASKRGAVGESAIDDGAEQLAALISRLGALGIFAQAGQALLLPELEGVKKVAAPYEQLTARAAQTLEKLGVAAQSLGKAATMGEEQLGQSVAHLAAGTLSPRLHHISCMLSVSDVGVNALTDQCLSVAAAAPDAETQSNVISATKAVAISAKQLVLSAKDVQRNKDDSLAQSAVAGFPSASSTLAQVLGGASSASPASASSLEAARKAVLDIAAVKANQAATAQSVLEAARGVSASATPLVFATNQDELNEGATDALGAVQELVANVKGASRQLPQIAGGLQASAKAATESMAALIDASSSLDRSNPQVGAKITSASAQLNESLEGLVRVLNTSGPATPYVLHNAQDVEKRTETELSAAVDYVKRVVSALPRVQAPAPGIVLNEKTLADALMAAVHEIAEATQKLISASAQAEKESRTKGDARYRLDPTWANGLVSAAHKVASGVGRLVSSVEKGSAGKYDEEELVASAKHVAASVKHLYMAARTRQGVSDATQIQIGDASKGVARASADLVKAAQQAGDLKQERDTASRKRSGSTFGASNIAAKLEQQAAILRLEKQLEDARRGLLKMNKQEAQSQRAGNK